LSSVQFFNADHPFRLLHKNAVKSWISTCALHHGCTVGDVSIIFCSDEYLLEMNKTHLEHDYYTDIITFDYTEGKVLNGELYISVDRVKDNAAQHQHLFRDEMHRVIIHGFLHLMGFKDKNEADEAQMRAKEDFCLNLRSF
jgi:rRNA maturation RNase YbeY